MTCCLGFAGTEGSAELGGWLEASNLRRGHRAAIVTVVVLQHRPTLYEGFEDRHVRPVLLGEIQHQRDVLSQEPHGHSRLKRAGQNVLRIVELGDAASATGSVYDLY